MPQTRFVDVRRFESIDSTNRYLLEEARAGAPEGVVAVADHQTAGRGRLGRSWEAPAGANLLLSVLLRPAVELGNRHLATTAVALAALDAIGTIYPQATMDVSIKWPNDLVESSGRKLAGILAESDVTSATAADGQFPPVIVGIGINTNWPATDADLPPELVGLATSLCRIVGAPVDREVLLGALLATLEPRVADLDSAAGRKQLAEGMASRCSTIGTRVKVDLPDGSFVGTATGISPDGHLIVATGEATRTVVAGDVMHVRPGL